MLTNLASLTECVWPSQPWRNTQLDRCGILTTAELWKAATQPVLLGLMPEALLNSAHHFSGQAVELNRLMLAHHGESALTTTTELEQINQLMGTYRLSQIAPPAEGGARGAAVLFTAPHGLWLHRDDHEDHKPEDYTSFLARDLAATAGALSLTWSQAEIDKSKQRSNPDELNRDPNYLSVAEHSTNAWNGALAAHSAAHSAGVGQDPAYKVLFDIHGRRDYHKKLGNDDSDIDIGLGAMRQRHPQLANYIAESMQQVLQEAVGRKWKVNGFPQLQGCWPAHLGRLTLTQQAVALEVVAIQLELSLKFRKELNHNRTLRHRVADVLVSGIFSDEILEQVQGAAAEVEQE